MKKTMIFVSMLAAAALALPATAQVNDGFFFNGSIGRSDMDRGAYDDHDTAWNFNAGYRWAVSPAAQLGVEVGHANLGKFKSISQNVSGKARLKGWTAGVNTHVDLTPDWYLAVRGGYFRGEMRSGMLFVPGDVDAAPTHVRADSNKWYLGAGFGYNTTDQSSIGLHYDRYEASRDGFKMNPDVWSLRYEYRF